MIPGGREFAKNLQTAARATRAHVVYLRGREGLTSPKDRPRDDEFVAAPPETKTSERSGQGRSGQASVRRLATGRRPGSEARRLRARPRPGWPSRRSPPGRDGRDQRDARAGADGRQPGAVRHGVDWRRSVGDPRGAAGPRAAVAGRLRRGARPPRGHDGGCHRGGAERAHRVGVGRRARSLQRPARARLDRRHPGQEPRARGGGARGPRRGGCGAGAGARAERGSPGAARPAGGVFRRSARRRHPAEARERALRRSTT